LPEECTVLTHCNAGALATAGYGTAVGVVRAAVEAGKKIQVFADETRPLLQGARLTAWELLQDRIPVTLITDNMAGYKIRRGGVGAVIVGADRIASNGDVANKIGTYPLSVIARENGVPFYVAAPLSTVDFSLASGDAIPIEERNPSEVTHWGETRLAPEGVEVWNPAFDVPPARNVTAIVTEAGVARPPYREALAALKASLG
jgi:methylthioribose-1-phosphate isomerase